MSKGGTPQTGSVFEIGRLRTLIELMEEHDLAEIELQQDSERISLKRAGTSPLTMPTGTAGAAPIPAAPVAAPTTVAGDGPNIVTINSPMVGTFYARPKPDASPFVSVGSAVSQETVVCIVEAMKVFNEIPAEVNGKIVAVLVEDGQPVDFDKPLFKVDTSGS